MKAKEVVSKVLTLYPKVREAVQKTNGDLDALCNVIKECSRNRIERYALASSNSVFNGLTLQFQSQEWDKDDVKNKLLTLLKLPNVVYRYEGANRNDKMGFESVLEKALVHITEDLSDAKLRERLLEEMRNTTEFVMDNSLHTTYNRLNPQVQSLLEKLVEVGLMHRHSNG